MARGSAGYDNQYTSTAGFQDAFQKSVDRGRANVAYRKKIRDEEAKELDEVNGELVVAPSGQPNYDAGVETMAREWKQGFADARAKFNRGDISADEYSQLKNDYLGRSKQYNAASENLKKISTDYDKAVQEGKVSDATPPKIRDVLDTLRKGSGDLMPKNIDGVPTLVGTTAGGQEVSVPISQLASGKNLFRFNEKVDLSAQKDAIVKDLDSFKRQFATADGSVYEKSLGADELRKRAGEKIDHILANTSTVKSLAADEYGILDDDPRWGTEEGQEEIKSFVRDRMEGELLNQVVERTTRVSPGSTGRTTSAEVKANAAGAGARSLQDRLGQQLKDYIGVGGGAGKALDEDAVKLLQGEVGGNVEAIEFLPEERNWFSPNQPPTIAIRKKGSKEELYFPVDGNPADLARMLALAKYGDAAIADTRNVITTQATGTATQGDVSQYDFDI